MAVRRRRASAPKGPSGPTSRVHTVESLEQWENMLAKAARSGRLVVLQLFQTNNYACSQMRAYFKRMSVDPALKGAIYAEVEVDQAEPELLEACGMVPGATKIPCYRLFVDGEEVEVYAGGVPSQVAGMIQRQLAALRSRRGGLLTKLLLAAGGAAALAAGLAWHFGRLGGPGAGGGSAGRDLDEELRTLGERIRLAQKRKLNCERAGKLKGAKNQARLLRQLEGEMATVQQLLQAKREKLNPSAAAKGTTTAGSGSGRRSSVDGSERGKGRSRREAAASSPLPYGMEPCDYSSEDEDQGSSGSAASRSSSGRRRSSSRRRSAARSSGAAAPAVLYSDEE